MALTSAVKQQIMSEHQRSKGDTGSVEVQVALLTEDINLLTEHFKSNKYDNHSRRGLLAKVNQRRKLLQYLKKNDIERYRALMSSLNLRDAT